MKWMQDHATRDEVRDLVVKEQLLNTLPENIRIWVKERKPKTSLEPEQLADDFVQARIAECPEDPLSQLQEAGTFFPRLQRSPKEVSRMPHLNDRQTTVLQLPPEAL